MSSDLTNVKTPKSDVSSRTQTDLPDETIIRAMTTRLRRGDIGQLPAILMLFVIVLIFEFVSGGVFLNPTNLSNLVLQEVGTAVVAMGAVMVAAAGRD